MASYSNIEIITIATLIIIGIITLIIVGLFLRKYKIVKALIAIVCYSAVFIGGLAILEDEENIVTELAKETSITETTKIMAAITTPITNYSEIRNTETQSIVDETSAETPRNTEPTTTTAITTTAPITTEKTRPKPSTTTKPRAAAVTTTAVRTTAESTEYIHGYNTYYEYSHYDYPYGYFYPEAASNSNTYGTGTAQATVTTTGVTAGYNSTGSINSTNTINAVRRYISAYPNAASVNITIPAGATAMSSSTAQKVIAAAGNKTVTLTGSASFGSVAYSLKTARNYYFQMSTTSSRYTSARNTIVRAFGNSDTRGFALIANELDVSATYRINMVSIGISVKPTDTVYSLFYNPATNGFTRKSLVVNSDGEIAYATSRGGVHLFSETPFAK
jgi:hypothetical protein